MSVLLERARESAECPPSLLSVALTQMDHHGFDAAMLQLLDTKGTPQGRLIALAGYSRVSNPPFLLLFQVFRFKLTKELFLHLFLWLR